MNDILLTIYAPSLHYFVLSQAFERFSEGVSANEDDYLDFSLVMEENFIAQYKNFF